MSIFVVGAKGYIGSSLLLAAKKQGSAVGTSSTKAPGLVPLNLGAPEDFDYSLLSAGDTVLLTAAISAPDVCANEYDYANSVNVIGTTRFIKKAIASGARIIFFSSDTVYGEQEQLVDEHAVCNPAGEYAQMKRAVEAEFESNASFKAIRLSYVFSKDDKYTRYLMACANKGEAAEVFDPFKRSVIHRGDVVDAAISLALHWDDFPEQIINFGGPDVLSRVDMAEALRSRVFSDLKIDIVDPGEAFFENRPKIISMSSPVQSRLLGRLPASFYEAISKEFN